MEFVVIVISALVIWFVVAVVRAMSQGSKVRKQIEFLLRSLPDFVASQQVIGFNVDPHTAIAIDEHRQVFCLVSVKNGNPTHRVVSNKEIVSVELFEDGVSLTKTNRGSQIGGALVGGIAFAGIGAVVGGLSGSKTTKQLVNRIDLRIVINDTTNPLHDVSFMLFKVQKDHPLYKQYLANARHWYALVEVLVKRGELEDKSRQEALANQIGNNTSANVNSYKAIADELKKLAELQASGVLTYEEFQTEKGKLLRSR